MEILFPDGVSRVSQEIIVRKVRKSERIFLLKQIDFRSLLTYRLSDLISTFNLKTMPHYYKLGNIPHKRHTQFRKPDGSLYAEQLFSTEGFSDDYSLLYHCHPPTQIIKTEPQVDVSPIIAEEKMLQHRSFEGFKVHPSKDFLQSRIPVLVNNDCHIVLAAPQHSMFNY